MRTTLIASGKPFEFSTTHQQMIKEIIAKYPPGREASAVLPLLDLAQRQNENWVSKEVVEKVAEILGMPVMRVFEVASFYTMFNLEPVGRYHIQVCRNTPCWLKGSDDILSSCKEAVGVGLHERSPDGLFSIIEVECMGACIHAPMVAINDDYYENLTPAGMKQIIKDLKGKK